MGGWDAVRIEDIMIWMTKDMDAWTNINWSIEDGWLSDEWMKEWVDKLVY